VRTQFAKVIFLELSMSLIIQRIMIIAAALSASAFIAACGAHSTNPSTETFTVYEDAPEMIPLDLGAPGNSLGDVYHFSAPLHSERGGPVTGELIGSKTLVKLPSDANPNMERRATLMFFTFAEGKDQIIAFGAADYSPTAGEFAADQPVVRPVLGGTGKYMGARGQVTSTRNSNGSYTQVFTLLK
jgi:hypothetical protein